MDYLPIIGLEIHVEPKTNAKMFCFCPADHFGKSPNTQTCPVCLGLPGALPVPNKQAIEACLKLGLALGCSINLSSKFDRKNYFYPDLPKAYQISQYDQPFCHQGKFDFQLETKNQKLKTINITRVHMEEDTGKLQHKDGNSLVDFNRSGVPLIEIVTEPDIRSPEEMTSFLKELVRLIRWLGISDCDMEKGSLRLEANISMAIKTSNFQLPDYKVEIKNVNSFRFLEKAVRFEIERQTNLLKKGQAVKQETRGFDEKKSETFGQRSKEEADDYRYFPEPDIPPIQLTKAYVAELKFQVDNLSTPQLARIKLIDEFRIRPQEAELLISTPTGFGTATETIEKLQPEVSPAGIATQIINQKIDTTSLSSDEIVSMIRSSKISYSIPEKELRIIVGQTIKANPKAIDDFKSGKQNASGFLIGQVAKQTKGQADPQLIQKILQQQLPKV